MSNSWADADWPDYTFNVQFKLHNSNPTNAYTLARTKPKNQLVADWRKRISHFQRWMFVKSVVERLGSWWKINVRKRAWLLKVIPVLWLFPYYNGILIVSSLYTKYWFCRHISVRFSSQSVDALILSIIHFLKLWLWWYPAAPSTVLVSGERGWEATVLYTKIGLQKYMLRFVDICARMTNTCKLIYGLKNKVHGLIILENISHR